MGIDDRVEGPPSDEEDPPQQRTDDFEFEDLSDSSNDDVAGQGSDQQETDSEELLEELFGKGMDPTADSSGQGTPTEGSLADRDDDQSMSSDPGTEPDTDTEEADSEESSTESKSGSESEPALSEEARRFREQIGQAAAGARRLSEQFDAREDPALTPVTKDRYGWTHFEKDDISDGQFDSDDGEDAREAILGFDPTAIESVIGEAAQVGDALESVIDERTVDVIDEVDEDAFFSTVEGYSTVTNRYDLEKAVPLEKKRHFREIDRYWVNKPYAFVILFHSRKENEKKYYLIEPHRTEIEADLQQFLREKLKTAIKYESEDVLEESEAGNRSAVIERETHQLLDRYDLYEDSGGWSFDPAQLGPIADWLGWSMDGEEDSGPLDGIESRPEPVLIEEDAETLSEYQIEKLLYFLKRDFVGFGRIDGIKHDINVEDISVDGYNSPVFVYHTDYENLITNVFHGKQELDDFVVKLAQRSGKGISKRQPQVDATLPDGSRAQLTLGQEVSDHGTNYTIRQFKDVPFTPIDLINWRTFSLDQMALLWLAIENNKSLIFAGGTASGKTTSLNAVSLFIPSNSKIVSIEDTREVELPQRNWIASVTRPSFADDDKGDIDEFDLLEAALRQRPDYIVMGEVRGEEGRTLFQVMSTGHTTYTTFHADTVGEVLKRFTTEPINVSKTLFTALDLVSIQTQTRVQGRKVRRSKALTEINEYNAENDEINVQDIYRWRAETDSFDEVGRSNLLDEIMFDRGWTRDDLEAELFKRRVILSYLIRNELNDYAQVAATVQAFINDQETTLSLVANDMLEESLADLREMESVHIDIDPEKEALVPRPDPTDRVYERTGEVLERAETELFEEYRDRTPESEDIREALATTDETPDVTAGGEGGQPANTGGEVGE
ncbi:MAG: type II/IV secretion system ATPase subunit [Halobacteriales archaeon]|nr:type II/IV secretion system ATPase subunit [Halobacteriales archaeon]